MQRCIFPPGGKAVVGVAGSLAPTTKQRTGTTSVQLAFSLFHFLKRQSVQVLSHWRVPTKINHFGKRGLVHCGCPGFCWHFPFPQCVFDTFDKHQESIVLLAYFWVLHWTTCLFPFQRHVGMLHAATLLQRRHSLWVMWNL